MACDGGCAVSIEVVDSNKANELSVNKHKSKWTF